MKRILCSLLITAALWSSHAFAQEASVESHQDLSAAECIAVHTEGQRQSQSGDLIGALESFTSCAIEHCPAVVSADCLNLRESVEMRLPTVIFSVTSATGKDLSDYQVHLDGELLLDRIDGRAFPVNPGERTISFIDAMGESHEQVVVFKEGEQARRVDYELPPNVIEPAVEPEPHVESTRIHPLTWVGAGFAVAGGGAFAGLALAGQSKKKALESECSPGCTDGQVAPIETMYLAADIALGVGIAGAAAAIVGLFLPTRPKDVPPDDSAVTLIPGVSGRTMFLYRGRF